MWPMYLTQTFCKSKLIGIHILKEEWFWEYKLCQLGFQEKFAKQIFVEHLSKTF